MQKIENKVAHFEKVSFEQFCEDFPEKYELTKEQIKELYDAIEIPKRATVGSAGHDFRIPFSIDIKPNETVLIPTGIRCSMENNYVLQIYPRSGLGFKYRLQLNNTVGIIDAR